MTDLIESERGLITNRFRAIQLSVANAPGAARAAALAATDGMPAHSAPPAPVCEPLLSPAPARRGAAFPMSRHLLTVAPLVACDVLALGGSALLGLLTVDALHAARLLRLPAGAPESFPWLCTLVMMPLVLAYWYRGLYPGVGLHPVIELCQAVKINATACLAVTAALLTTRGSPAWAIFFAVAWASSAVLVPLSRTQTRRLCARFPWWGYPAVVITTGAVARETIAALLERPECGLRPCGIVDPTGEGAGLVLGVPYLDATVSRTAPYALVALPDVSRGALFDVLDAYHNRFPHLLVLSDGCGSQSLWRDARDCGSGLAGTELRNKLLLPWPRFIKRFVDITMSGAALLAGSPLLVALALAVRLSSPGPIFFAHTRLGRDHRRFKAWKFRTMRVDAEALLRGLLASDLAARGEWERDHKLRKDPRVTPIGNFLRRTSLDELPQFWNVMRGDMSLVGPRPIVASEVIKYGSSYPLYSEVTPGITGLWQVSGRNDTTYQERVRLDAFYVRNWSPWLDLHILVRTIGVVVNGKGAC